MLKHVYQALKKDLTCLSKKHPDGIFSNNFYIIFTFLLIIEYKLLESATIDSLIEGLLAIALLCIFIVALRSGFHSADYFDKKKIRNINCTPVGRLKHETRVERWITILITFMLLVALPMSIAFFLNTEINGFRAIPFLTIPCFLGFCAGLHLYYKN